MRKVVVTGMGVISPVGNSLAAFTRAIRDGKSGIGPITQVDTEGLATKIAAEVRDFTFTPLVDKKYARKMARFTQFAVSAAAEALLQAGLVNTEGEERKLLCNPDRAAVALGNGIGGFEIITESFKKLFEQGPARMLPLTIPLMISNEAAANISMVFGARGPSYTQATACASGADALGQGLDLIRAGRADVVISGGTESTIARFAVAGFNILKTLSTKRNDEPEKASRPFDVDRDGFVLGEGAGVLVLESEEHALRRNAVILAEFAGYGASSDAYHITSPDPSGEGGSAAIKLALEDARLAPDEIQYYNAHGTSTKINDITETKMLKIAFGNYARSLKISSIKSMTGHCIAGAGGLEAIACIQAIREGFFPPTINLDTPDPECDLDYVPNKAQFGTINAAASGNLGFGGHNGVVVFKKYGT
jgi:3-oxoacyl-[acyl-carrier-protein] synthase II